MNTDGQSETPTIAALLSSGMASAIAAGDAPVLRAQIAAVQAAPPLVQTWLESLGTRLAIRDLLVDQKAKLARLASSQDADIEQGIRDFLRDLDRSLEELTGAPGADSALLQSRRIERLRREPDDSLLALVKEFMHQSTRNPMLSPDRLIRHVRDVRDDIVDCLWPVVSTLGESGGVVAQQELIAEVTRLRGDIDKDIVNVIKPT